MFTTIDGIKHKACYGRLHPEGKWVPISQFHNRRWASGRKGPRPNCKACESAARGVEQQVPFRRFSWMIEELVARLGQAEAARRIGIRSSTMWEWRHNPPKMMHRKSARKILLALHEVREKREVRHRLSIHHGSSMRGKPEKIPKKRSDYYKPHGDADNESKRRLWANMDEERREQQLARERERKRKKPGETT